MGIKVKLCKNLETINKCCELVVSSFDESEKSCYNDSRFIVAKESLRNLDMLKADLLLRLVEANTISIIGVYFNDKLHGCFAVNATNNRILFFAVLNWENNMRIAEFLLSYLLHYFKKPDDDSSFRIIAFAGSVPFFRKLGFVQGKKTPIEDNNILVMPMTYSFGQFDNQFS